MKLERIAQSVSSTLSTTRSSQLLQSPTKGCSKSHCNHLSPPKPRPQGIDRKQTNPVNCPSALQEDDKPAAPLVSAIQNVRDTVWLDRRRTGHLSLPNLKKLLRASPGLLSTEKEVARKTRCTCATCRLAKSIDKRARAPVSRRYKNIGDLLHLDIYHLGDVPDSWDGSKYSLMGTDDATRGTWSRRMERRNDLTSQTEDLVRMIERTYNTKVRRVQFDTEFHVPQELKDFLENEGITIEASAPRAHHPVGVQERTHRVFRDKTAAMIIERQLPRHVLQVLEGMTHEDLDVDFRRYVIEAVEHAIWLENRCTTKAISDGKTQLQCPQTPNRQSHCGNGKKLQSRRLTERTMLPGKNWTTQTITMGNK
jgi:hypothetical protein